MSLSLIGQGLAAAVYTQTTDVEGEVNGLMTYDRAVLKFDQDQMRELNRRVYEPQPDYERAVVLPSSQEEGQSWAYVTEDPGDAWFQTDFDANEWKEGPGGFGTEETPGTVVRTEWNSSDIWLRRSFELGEGDLGFLSFSIHHDEDVEIYINGEKTESFSGYESGYVDVEASEATRNALKPGQNVIAVHCRQTDGGQYIDLGLVTLKEKQSEADSDGTTEQ